MALQWGDLCLWSLYIAILENIRSHSHFTMGKTTKNAPSLKHTQNDILWERQNLTVKLRNSEQEKKIWLAFMNSPQNTQLQKSKTGQHVVAWKVILQVIVVFSSSFGAWNKTVGIAVDVLRMSPMHIHTSWIKELSLLYRNQPPMVHTYSYPIIYELIFRLGIE